MKKSFGLLILLLLFTVGCACPYAPYEPEPKPPVNSEYAEQLAKQFCPIIYLKGEGEAIENFEPEQIEIMVDEAFLRDTEDPSFFEKATLPGLLQWSGSIYYLDLEGLGPSTHSPTEYQLNYDTVKSQYQPTLYARVKEGGDGDYTVVQYWIFYYFNDWRNLHEGDWELVQLCFPGKTVKELLQKGEQPVFAAYSQHQAGQRMSWSDMVDESLVEGTHPIVYVAQGSHANYFVPGNFWSGLDFDDTGLSSWQIITPEQLDIVLLHETEAEEEGLEWLRFRGRWGEYLGFSISVLNLRFWQRGPFGPSWSEGGQKSTNWEQPEEWASGLSEYPKPFWVSLLSLPGDWSTLAIFSLFSPAELHVYDAVGRHVGINEEGELETQISGAMYVTPRGTDYKTILIPDADVSDEYTIVAEGTDSGIMDIKAQVPDAKTNLRRFLEYTNVPVSATTVARARIEPEIPPLVGVPSPAEILGGTRRDTVTRLEIDSNGDGVFEIESTPGDFERQKAVLSELIAKVGIEPDTLNLTSIAVDEPITAYIELPEGFDPKDIDISTVRLLGGIPAWDRTIDVVDHDQDGIYELVVKFDRQLVIDYLVRQKQVEGEVSLILTGVVDGRLFKGLDTILVIRNAVGQTQSD